MKRDWTRCRCNDGLGISHQHDDEMRDGRMIFGPVRKLEIDWHKVVRALCAMPPEPFENGTLW